jgi:hypothetical protein
MCHVLTAATADAWLYTGHNKSMDLLHAWQCPWNSKTFTAAAEEGNV